MLMLEQKRKNNIFGELSNGKVTKHKKFMSKTINLHVHHTFLYSCSPFLPYDDVKMPNFAFYGKRKQATTKFYFSL